ncbi:MAG: hypothetical protein ABIR33_04460 [Pyrinomonadaceae bacterium]
MKGSSAFAIAVCIACFLIGYLTYTAASFFIDFFVERAVPCNTVQACAQQERTPKDR